MSRMAFLVRKIAGITVTLFSRALLFFELAVGSRAYTYHSNGCMNWSWPSVGELFVQNITRPRSIGNAEKCCLTDCGGSIFGLQDQAEPPWRL